MIINPRVGDIVKLKECPRLAVIAFSGLHYGLVGVRVKRGGQIVFLKPDRVEELEIPSV